MYFHCFTFIVYEVVLCKKILFIWKKRREAFSCIKFFWNEILCYTTKFSRLSHPCNKFDDYNFIFFYFNSFNKPQSKSGQQITNANRNKRLTIDESLFIEPPLSVENSRTPVCDFVYREISGAKFFTSLSKKQRKILWDFLGPAKYHLQGLSWLIA